jgi:DNA-binding SARP family transcriptional activator
MRWINRIGNAVLALLVVVGPPLVVGIWASQRQWGRPTLAGVQAWWEQPLTAATILVGLATVAATGWLLLVAYLLRRAAYVVAGWGRRVRRMPLPTSAQVTASSMAGVAALAMPTLTAAHPDGIRSDAGTSASPLALPVDPVVTDDSDLATVEAGIELPDGGWIPYRTALAVASVSGLIWLHRRHSYQPGPPRLGHHHDTDLQPLPTTADTITAAVTADPAAPSLPQAGLAVLDELPAGVLHLHGPGATDAARGLLITAVLGAALNHQIEVTVRRRDLLHLTGTDISDRLPGLTTVNRDDLLFAAGSGMAPASDPRDRLVLQITRRPPATDRAAAAAAPAETVTVVTVEDAAIVENGWRIGADGTITGAASMPATRLPVLARQATADLLHLVELYSAAQRPTPPPADPDPEPTAASALGVLTLLGGCRLSVHGKAVRVRRSAGLQILAYLAVRPEGATTIDLIRAIWPGPPASAITKRLHTTLTDLRQQLQPLFDDPVVRRDDRYQLNTEIIDTDLRHLRQAITAATTAVTPDHQRTAVTALLETYPGDLAAGFTWPWLNPAREALRREVIDAYLQLAAAAPAEHAVDLVRAATAIDPYNEHLHHHSQRLLRAAGHHDAADALHRAHAQRLITAGLHPAGPDDHRSVR